MAYTKKEPRLTASPQLNLKNWASGKLLLQHVHWANFSKQPTKPHPTATNYNLQTNTENYFSCHFRSEFHLKYRSVFIQLVPYMVTIWLFFNANSINSERQLLVVHSLEEKKEIKGKSLCLKWGLYNVSRNKSRKLSSSQLGYLLKDTHIKIPVAHF